MNIFEQYGIKEVADVTIYAIELDKHDREIYVPVMYLDTLKVSTLEQTADQTTAKGGRGNADFIAWDYGKTIDLNIEDALYTPASQSLMWGGKFGTKKPRVRGLWNPMVYPKDRYGRTKYVKRKRLIYGNGKAKDEINDIPAVSPGFFDEDKINEADGLELSCKKNTLSFYVGPIFNMNNLLAAYGKIKPTAFKDGTLAYFNQYIEGNWDVHSIDHSTYTDTVTDSNNIQTTVTIEAINTYRKNNFYQSLQEVYPEVNIYRKSLQIKDSENTIQDINDTSEYFYFTFINDELISAFEKIQANIKAAKALYTFPDDSNGREDTSTVDTFIKKMTESISYMKAHKNELGVFNEAHLISDSVKSTFLFMIKEYYKNDFFSKVTYDLNACETAYELYEYVTNDGELKYEDLNKEIYFSKLVCPMGYDTVEEKANGDLDLLNVYNWSNLSSKLTQKNRPERAEIILDNYGDFSYYNQSMKVGKKYYFNGFYYDTETGASNEIGYTRKVEDTYANNKEFVMQYYNQFNAAVKKGKLDKNPFILEQKNQVIFLKKPVNDYPEKLTWQELMAYINEDVTVKGVNNTIETTKYFSGTYGKYQHNAQTDKYTLVDKNEKNTNAMQAGFFTKQYTKGNATTQIVCFKINNESYKYPVYRANTTVYNDDPNTKVWCVKVPVIKATENYKGYWLAEANAKKLKEIVSDEAYQFISPQFTVLIPPGTTENLKDMCVYGAKTINSLNTCTSSKTAHSYVWANTDLKMISFEGDQDIYYSEHANLRYRTPQNSSIKEIGIAQQGLYATAISPENTVKKEISFTFYYYGDTSNTSTKDIGLSTSLSNVLEDFNSSGSAKKIFKQLKNTENKTKLDENNKEIEPGKWIITLGDHRYGKFTMNNNDATDLAIFIANNCSDFAFDAHASKFKNESDNLLSMTIVLYGFSENGKDWNAIGDDEITSVTSLERRFNEKESYGYFLKDYSPIVSFYKTIKTTSVGGNTNLIRVPVGDFYIVSDWNYDGSTEYDYPYAIESGMEDTAVLDRMEKCRATRTFAINTSRNVTMFNYSTISAYSHTPLTAFIDPRTMKPYEPNADSFTRASGDVIEGTLRIIKKDEIYYKWTRTVAPEHNSVGRSIIVDAEHFPGTYRIVGETYARLRADGKDQRYQFEIPLAKLSAETNLTLQADGDPTTFNMRFKVLRKRNGQMMKFTQYTVDNQEYNDYKSGSTKVVAVDASAVTTDNEIAREVNAI